MNSLAQYSLDHFVKKAANDNKVPRSELFIKFVKIGIVIGPIVAWLLWVQ